MVVVRFAFYRLGYACLFKATSLKRFGDMRVRHGHWVSTELG